MCHLILMLPLLALPVFWLLPLSVATPVYLVIAATSGVIYWLIVRAMARRPAVGVETMIGAQAKVISVTGSEPHSRYIVRTHGELWTARSQSNLVAGENVTITALNGMTLDIKRQDAGRWPMPSA